MTPTGLRSVLALALALTACIGVRQIEVPPNDGARSVLIVFRDADAQVVYAADVTETLEEALPPFGGSADARDIFVVEYACPLARMGLAPGAQALVADRPTFLPAPLSTYARGGGAWMRAPALPDDVRALLSKVRPLEHLDCPKLGTVAIPAAIELGVGLSDGSVLAGVSEGIFYRASPASGEAERLSLFSGKYRAAHRTGEEVYMIGSVGQLARGPIDSGLTFFTGASYPEKQDHIWFDGSDARSPLELYRLNPKGMFERFAGTSTTWQPAGLTLSPRTDVLAYAGIAWVKPGEAIAVGGHLLSRFREGESPQFQLERQADPEFTAVAFVPALGIVVGDADGRLFRFIDEDLHRIEGVALGSPITGIAPLGSGLLAVTAGRVDYFDGTLRPCLEDSIVSVGPVKRMATSTQAAVLESANVVFFTAPDLSGLTQDCSGKAE